MNKASERYNTKVEIPISVILETIFSDDNHDVETLCRWAKHYGFVDLVKENKKDKLGYYKLQDDYTKQSFYICLDKEERKQYDYEDFLLDEIEAKNKEIDRLNNIANELKEDIEFCLKSIKQEYKMSTDERTRTEMESCKQILEERLEKLKEGKQWKKNKLKKQQI